MKEKLFQDLLTSILQARLTVKKPSLKIYQNYARIYLDEYQEQKESRKEYFAKRWNLQNEAIKKVA